MIIEGKYHRRKFYDATRSLMFRPHEGMYISESSHCVELRLAKSTPNDPRLLDLTVKLTRAEANEFVNDLLGTLRMVDAQKDQCEGAAT